MHREKQLEVIKKGLNYWLDEACSYLLKHGHTALSVMLIEKVGTVGEITDADEAAEKFRTCLADTALAFRDARRERGLDKFNEIMEKALPAGYESAYGKASRNTEIRGFRDYVVQRDIMLGMDAGIMEVSDTEFRYWILDPFAVLKDKFTEQEYERISTHGYVATKMRYFFGDDSVNWDVTLEKSPWRPGNKASLWRIKRRLTEGGEPGDFAQLAA